MASEIIEIDGKRMKRCPGWEGNSGNCGRGNPRLIPETAEVCENCSRGMRKAGQKTREEQERQAAKEREAEKRLALGVAAFEKALGVPVRKDEIVNVLEALETITEADLGETYGYWAKEKIGEQTKFAILYAVAGIEPPEKLRAGRRG